MKHALLNYRKIKILNTVSVIILSLCFSVSQSWGQTNPTPYDLSSGNWTFTGWNASVPTGSFPGNGANGVNNTTGVVVGAANANMVFWTHNTNDPAVTTNFTGDWSCRYNYTSRSRIQGRGTDGVMLTNTGNKQTVTCCNDGTTCGSGTEINTGYIGAIVLGLNSTGRENIQVQWTAKLIAQQPRIYRLRIQYRTNLSGGVNANWQNLSPVEEYTTESKATGDVEAYTTSLPSACNNQSSFQIRWVYYYVSGSGARPEIALDEINVSSSPTGAPTITTGTVSGTPFTMSNCSSTVSTTVNYTITGTYNSSNIFTAELSDASGSFSQPLAIGSVTSTSGGSISATIPENLISGTGYRIRVVASNPVTEGSQSAAFTITQNGEYCPQLGDYRTNGSNTWATVSIWQTYNYVSASKTRTWQAATVQPNNASVSVYVKNAHTVTLSDGPKSLNNIIVETGGRLYRNDASCNVLQYINLGGDILCNGDMGNGTTSDAIGINVQAGNHLIKGTGNFNAWRIRLSDENNDGATRGNATLTIDMNIALRWPGTIACSGSGGNAVYNNRAANSIFDIVVNAGRILTITNSNASFGMDGANAAPTVYPGTNRGGGYTVYGTIDCAGQYMLGSNNPATQRPYLNIKNGGLVKVGFLDYGDNNIASGGALTIENGGKLEITGANLGNTWDFSNTGTITYIIQSGSTIEYSSNTSQNIPGNLFNYHHLIKSGAGTATLTSAATVNGNFTISSGVFNISENNYTLNIGGNWLNNATFTPHIGSVIFFGNQHSNINNGGLSVGKRFYNIEVDKSNSTFQVNTSSNVKVENLTDIKTGTLNVNSNHTFESFNVKLNNANSKLDIKANGAMYVNP